MSQSEIWLGWFLANCEIVVGGLLFVCIVAGVLNQHAKQRARAETRAAPVETPPVLPAWAASETPSWQRDAERLAVRSQLTDADLAAAAQADERLWEDAASRDYQQARRG